MFQYILASIMAGGSHMQSSFNSIKLENPGYYCNSYTPPGPADHHAMIPASGYSKFILCNIYQYSLSQKYCQYSYYTQYIEMYMTSGIYNFSGVVDKNSQFHQIIRLKSLYHKSKKSWPIAYTEYKAKNWTRFLGHILSPCCAL